MEINAFLSEQIRLYLFGTHSDLTWDGPNGGGHQNLPTFKGESFVFVIIGYLIYLLCQGIYKDYMWQQKARNASEVKGVNNRRAAIQKKMTQATEQIVNAGPASPYRPIVGADAALLPPSPPVNNPRSYGGRQRKSNADIFMALERNIEYRDLTDRTVIEHTVELPYHHGGGGVSSSRPSQSSSTYPQQRPPRSSNQQSSTSHAVGPL